MRDEKTYFMNVAPNAAAGNGFVRLVLEMDGEKIVSSDANIGFSHRGIEKTLEFKNVLQSLCYFDSIRMLTPLSQEHAFVLAIEKLCGVVVPERARFIRVIMAELSRILSHLNAVAALASDLGERCSGAIVAQTSRKIASLFQKACGMPVPKAYFRPGGVKADISKDFIAGARDFVTRDLPEIVAEIKTLTVENRIFADRTRGIGAIDSQDASAYGFSGVNLRATGEGFDLRKAMPYDAYARFSFDVPVASEGDCFARTRLRLEEVSQSGAVVLQALDGLPDGAVSVKEFSLSEKRRSLRDTSLAASAARFDFYTRGTPVGDGEVFVLTEAPFGAFGVYAVSDGKPFLYRCHIRSAGFAHLQALKIMIQNGRLEDLRPIISSLDIQMPEVDR